AADPYARASGPIAAGRAEPAHFLTLPTPSCPIGVSRASDVHADALEPARCCPPRRAPFMESGPTIVPMEDRDALPRVGAPRTRKNLDVPETSPGFRNLNLPIGHQDIPSLQGKFNTKLGAS